jgi:hypothetical protein
MQQIRHYPCKVQPDGTFEAQDIPAGAYDLSAVGYVIKDAKPDRSWNVNKPFTIPEGTPTDHVLDLGTIPMAPAPGPGK